MPATSKSVMVVDDDDALRDSLCDLLEEDGYRTSSAADGAAALERLRRDPARPDLILLDLVMGGLNGWQFRKAQLADPTLAEIPVVVLSAGREVRGVKADAVVTKPIDLGTLLKLVRQHTGRPPIPSRVRAPSAPVAPGEAGDAGRLARSFDWSRTPLGPFDAWPQSLRTAADICLGSRTALWLAWGPELTFIYNDAYRPILRNRHPWALGRPMQEVWPEIWSVIGPMIRGVMERGEASWQDDQMLILERAGIPEETYFTYSCSPVRDEAGAVGGVFTTVLESTARVLVLRRMQCLRELVALAPAESIDRACAEALEVLGRSAADIPFAGLYLMDSARRDARLAAHTGFEAPDAVAPPHLTLGSGADAWGLAEVAAAGVPRLVDLSTQPGTYPGGPWPEPSRAALVVPIVQVAAESLLGFLVAGISPRLEFDDDYRAFLEAVADHLEAVLARARLIEEKRQRIDRLAALDRAKTAFFATVGHELHTPLTLLLAPLADYLQEGALADRETQDARVCLAHRSAVRLLKLVNTLLEYTRVQAGRVEAKYRPVELGRFTAEITSFFWSACRQAGLELVVACPPLPLPVYVDKDMWEKIVLNLVSNALKFTFVGRIEVALTPRDDGVELTVRDTGVGIPPEETSRVFEQFHRVRGSRSRTHEGMGIGLALVSELVRLHAGTIAVESEVGVGSTFTVKVPYGTAHLPPEHVHSDAGALPSVEASTPYVQEALAWLPDETAPQQDVRSPADAARAHIVVIDDNRDMRRYIADLLSGRWRVTVYADGEQALAGIAADVPDLVVSDVMMPGLDGFGLLARLRADAQTASVPVILVSAQTDEEARVQGLAAGAEDYLVKPFSGRELVARVGAHLSLLERRRAAERVIHAENAKAQDAARFQSIGKLAGGIAHEFNNLLTSVIGYAALCLDEPDLSEPLRENLSEVQASAERAALVTRQLLAYGQKQTLRPVRLAIREFLEGLQPSLAGVAGQAMNLQIEVPDGLPDILADSTQIEAALRHLVANAREAMAPGGVVTIEGKQVQLAEQLTLDTGRLDPGAYVVLAVRDTGRGIDPAARSRMFEPFYSTKAGGPSQGLGLSVVVGVVRQSGGQIRVQSQAGEGTSVELFLPVRIAAPPVAAVTEPRAPASETTVLVAEDEPSVRGFVTMLLQSVGYRVFEAQDGQDALDVASRIGSFDLLVTDVMMPRLNGPDLARNLTRRTPGLRVLFMSGYSGDDVVREGLIEEGAAFLQKPFVPKEFRSRVEELLNGRAAESE